MKYYLFKSDNCELLDIMFEGYLGDKVELTEDGMQTLVDLTTTVGPNELNYRLRKVLDNE